MRSDRDIKRTPRRPLPGTPAAERADTANGPAEAPPRQAVPSTARLHPAPGAPAVPVVVRPAAPARPQKPAGSAPRRPDASPQKPPRRDTRSEARPAAPSRADRPDRPDRAQPPAPRPDRPPRPQSNSPSRPDRQDRPPRAQAGPAQRQDRPTRAPAVAPRNPDDGVRLSKILSDRGLASRREADDWIDAGWVKVDGQMAVLGQRVRPEQRIEVDPIAHEQQAKRVTLLLNKPIGYVSGQAEDGHEPASVLVTAANHWAEDPSRKAFHAGHARHLAPAGRLDIDSTGLLVLTQDGRIAKHLIGENSDVEKEYLVRVEHMNPGTFPEEGLERLRHGLVLDEVQLRPARVSWANEDQLRFVLREGRKRQIRRMCELVGLKVVGLKRVRIGSVVLGKLPPGQWRYLRDDERF